MARAAQTAAQNASNTYSGYAGSALNNFNSDAAQTNDQISSLEGSNPYTSKSAVQNQNLLTSAAMSSQNTAAKQQLDDQALRTGTNTASLGRTISSNARAGQRQMDTYNAGQAQQNTDKSVALQQGLIGDSQNLANSEAGIYGTSANAQTGADGQLVTLQGQNDQMWGNVIAGASALGGAAIGKI